MDSKENVEKKQRRSNNGKLERYSYNEDMAIIEYITTDKRYLKASGIQVWKEAEEIQLCPGRPYLSMKERFRKVLVKNLNRYNVDKETISKITQYMRASKQGKQSIRSKEFRYH